MGTATISPAVQSIIHFAEGLIADPALLSDERRRARLRRLLFRVVNGSPNALRLAERFERGEIDGDKLLEMMD